MRLGIDLDGVCYPFHEVCRVWFAQRLGRWLPPVTTWDFHIEQWGISEEYFRDELELALVSGDLWWQGTPTPGCRTVLQRLAVDHEIIIVTHRAFKGFEIDTRWATYHWLSHHRIAHHELIFSKHKVELGLDLLLDDAPRNLNAAMALDEIAIAYDRPWNRDVVVDHRVHGFWDFERLIQRWNA